MFHPIRATYCTCSGSRQALFQIFDKLCFVVHSKLSLFTQFLQRNVGLPTPKALREGCTLPHPSPWPPRRITVPGSATGDCDNAFSNKKFEKDLLVTFCTLTF